MLFDLSLPELQRYLPERNEPQDFDAFWLETLAAARKYPLDAVFTPVDYAMALVDTYDVTFNGYGGQPVKGWLILPKNAEKTIAVRSGVYRLRRRPRFSDRLAAVSLRGIRHFCHGHARTGFRLAAGRHPRPAQRGFQPAFPPAL